MLTRVEIHDFALIDHALLEPENGLLIMTGETGAGKSILVDAISAICGSRVRKDMVRHGQEKAVIEAVFEQAADFLPRSLQQEIGLDEQAEDEDDQLILTRELSSAGRSLCRINGRLAPLNLLREVMGYLVNIHGQHDQQSIFDRETHVQLLDRFGGDLIHEAKQPYRQTLAAWRQGQKKLGELGEDPAQRARMIDMLRYQVNEIEAAGIRPQEDEQLASRRRVLANAEKIGQALSEAYDLLSGDSSEAVLAALGRASEQIQTVVRHVGELAEAGAQVEESRILLENATADLRSWLEDFELDPGELAQVDERLDLLFRLKQKYGGSLEAISRFHQKAGDQLEALDAGEASYEKLLRQQRQLEDKLEEQAARLTKARQQVGRQLEKRIAEELADLGMPRVRFFVSLSAEDNKTATYSASGRDQVEFNLSANPGEPPKPLARIASGGEASRIMLAIKVILAQADQIPVLIFDEIDSGVSGHTADRVAEKLLRISRNRQVFCITHLAQLAAMADTHIRVEKATREQRTTSNLVCLDSQKRIDELGRLLSGGSGQTEARMLAGQLLEQAQSLKTALFQSSPVSRS